MPIADRPRFTLVGGGLGGALLAVYLGKAGYEVDLFERRPDPHAGQMVGGRSINLAISTRGIHALAQVGLADEVLKTAVPMRGRMIHGLSGDLHFQPYDKDPERCINSIGRGALNTLTLEAAARFPNVRIQFNQKCVDVDLDRPIARFEDVQTHNVIDAEGGVVLGVDGAFSAVRRAMQRLDRFDYSQDYLKHGYKELTIPPADSGGHRLEPNALHIWPRRRFMMIALPNADGSFTCTLFFQFDGPQSFGSLRTDDDVRRFFDAHFPDAVPLMPTLLEDFRQNPTGSMVTVRCWPWHYRGHVALAGDAAHAVVPFYGQGANAAFEDCTVLDECIRQFAPDWERVFDQYQVKRKVNVDTLADLAIGNFIEMRDKTGSRLFRAYKRFDRTMHRLLPKWYTPLYTMVSFTQVPYAEAVRRADFQNRVLTTVGELLSMLGLVVLGVLMTDLPAWTIAVAAAVVVYVGVRAMRAASLPGRREARLAGARSA